MVELASGIILRDQFCGINFETARIWRSKRMRFGQNSGQKEKFDFEFEDHLIFERVAQNCFCPKLPLLRILGCDSLGFMVLSEIS